MSALAYTYRKAPRGSAGLMSPFDRRMAINSTYALYRIHSGSIWDLTQVYLEYKLVIEVCSTIPPNYSRRKK